MTEDLQFSPAGTRGTELKSETRRGWACWAVVSRGILDAIVKLSPFKLHFYFFRSVLVVTATIELTRAITSQN